MTPDTPILIVVAIIGFVGNIVAVVGAAYLNQRGNKKAAEDARDASANAAANATKAQIATAAASRDAANAARALVEAAKETGSRLDSLQKSAYENMTVTDETHKIVNSQRTEMKNEIEELKNTVRELAEKLHHLEGGARRA